MRRIVEEELARLPAKSKPCESIRQHTNKLLQCFDELLSIYSSYFSEAEIAIIRLAAEYHDYGKLNYAFWNKLLKAMELPSVGDRRLDDFYQNHEEIPHGYLSPAFLPLNDLRAKYGAPWLYALINAIFYHHTRRECRDKEIVDVLDNDLKQRFGNTRTLKGEYLSYRMSAANPPKNEGDWMRYALVKGMLNRIDYAASSGDHTIELEPLCDGWGLGDTVENKLNSRWQLRDVQLYMKNNRNNNLVVVASTGIGKTEAACLWAGSDKLFYTLPLKISINAIYKRISGEEEEEYGYKNATLLHSDALSYILNEEDEDEDHLIKYRRTRSLVYPLTVCTVDQLFTFVYRYLGCEMILATLKYSRVVIDEIQAYSPDIAARLIYGLKIIKDMGGRFAVMTATMPPILEHFMNKYGVTYEKPEPFFSPIKERHYLRYSKGEFNFDEILKTGKTQKVLVLCNTVNRACYVYEKLGNCGLLHSRFQKRHRLMLERDIISFSEDSRHGIWVATQIVEASLDLDFDVLYTEMCPADSLLQRLGRCYRKRSYTKDVPNVFIYDTERGVGTVYRDRAIYDNSVQLLQPYCDRIFTEAEKNDYVNAVYAVEVLRGGNYFRELDETLKNLAKIPPALVTKAEATAKFRDIMSETVIDETSYNELLNSGVIDRVTNTIMYGNAAERQHALDEIMSYTVSINPNFAAIKPDKESIFDFRLKRYTRICRIQAKYEFDEEERRGRGLIWEPCSGTMSIQL